MVNAGETILKENTLITQYDLTCHYNASLIKRKKKNKHDNKLFVLQKLSSESYSYSKALTFQHMTGAIIATSSTCNVLVSEDLSNKNHTF